MSDRSDPLARLRLANPLPSVPLTDWEPARERIERYGAHTSPTTVAPRRVRRLALSPPAGIRAHGWRAAIVTMAAAGVVVAAIALAFAASPSGRLAPSLGGCGRPHRACAGDMPALDALRQSDALESLRSEQALPSALRTCSVAGPTCAHGCLVPVAAAIAVPAPSAPPGALPPAKRAPCAQTTQRPCVENVAATLARAPFCHQSFPHSVRKDFERLSRHAPRKR